MPYPLSSNTAPPTVQSFSSTPVPSPVCYPATIGTASQQVAPQNLARQGVTFANPGSVTIYVCPATDNNGNPLSAGGAGSIPVAPGTYLSLSGRCGCAWNAAAASGSGNPFTAWEFVG